LTYSSIIIAGWLAMMSAFFSIPMTYVSYLLEGRADTEAIAAHIAIQAAGALLYVAINLYLRRLLDVLFRFRDTARCIDLMIAANVAVFVISEVARFSRYSEQLLFTAIGIQVFQGMVQVRFGYRLRKLPYDLDGMAQPFCFLNMATGVCIASVLLLYVGVVVSAITDLMLGTIFFHIARMAREANSADSGG